MYITYFRTFSAFSLVHFLHALSTIKRNTDAGPTQQGSYLFAPMVNHINLLLCLTGSTSRNQSVIAQRPEGTPTRDKMGFVEFSPPTIFVSVIGSVLN